MLADRGQFALAERGLREQGNGEEFEMKNGLVKVRMMIRDLQIPDEIKVNEIEGKKPIAFEASFDFYDTTLGIVIYTDTLEIASKMWYEQQKEDAEIPSKDWRRFFIEKLSEGIAPDGSYATLICSFINDKADLTTVPAW